MSDEYEVPETQQGPSEEDVDPQKNKFWWLRANRFFELTPLSGYAFILTSKTLLETGFWYLLILVFSILTLNNVVNATNRYLSLPTRTYVQPAAITKDIRLANFSLTLTLSMLEVSPQYPMAEEPNDAIERLGHDETVLGHANVHEYYACNNPMYLYAHLPEEFNAYMKSKMGNTYRYLWSVVRAVLGSTRGEEKDAYYYYDTNYNIQEEEFIPWFEENPLEVEKNLDDTLTSILENTTLITWKETLQEQAAQLKSFWNGNHHRPMTDPSIHDEVIQNINRPIDENIWQVVLKLLLSQQFKHINADGLVSLFTSDMSANPIPMTGEDIMTGLKLVMKVQNDSVGMPGISAFDLIKDSIHSMSKILHVRNLNEEQGAVHLNLDDFTYKSQKNRMIFKFRVLIPANATKVELEFRSYAHMWFIYLLHSLYDEAGKKCDSLGVDNFKIQQEILKAVRNYYRATSSLKIVTNRGNSVIMTPLQLHNFRVKPTGQFYSRIDNCYNHSYEYCMDDCLNIGFLAQCKCVRWDLMYLESGKGAPPCTMHCFDKTVITNDPRYHTDVELGHIELDCVTKCIRAVQHPCDMSIYELEQNTEDMTMSELMDPDSPLFYFNMEREAVFNHPVFIEEYQMTLPMFMSELGGLIELWSGINVIGVIHIVIYVIKQVRHARDPTSKTGRTLRRLFTGSDPLAEGKKDSSADNKKEHWTRMTKSLAPVIDLRMQYLENKFMNMSKELGEKNLEMIKEEKEETKKEPKKAFKTIAVKQKKAEPTPPEAKEEAEKLEKLSKLGWGSLAKIGITETEVRMDGDLQEEVKEMNKLGKQMMVMLKEMQNEMKRMNAKRELIMKTTEDRISKDIVTMVAKAKAEIMSTNEEKINKVLADKLSHK